MLVGRGTGAASTNDWIVKGQRFCRAILREGLANSDIVFAYSSAALELFEVARSRGLKTVLDHATAPRDREMEIVAEEEAAFAGWALDTVREDPALGQYARRQALERDLADTILCGSRFIAGLLEAEGADRTKIRTLPLGVDSSFFALERSKRRSDGLNVLFVGNEGLRKGLGYLVRAIDEVNSTRVHLRVAGDLGFSAVGMAEVRRRCEECRPVPRQEVMLWFQWADVLVLPTVSDTFGLAILEAMAAGVPVITTAASGGPDVLRDGVDGWLVPRRNSAAIAQCLDRLAADPELCRAMGAQAKLRAREFDEKAYSSRLLQAVVGD